MRKIVDLETVSTDIIQNSIYYIFFFYNSCVRIAALHQTKVLKKKQKWVNHFLASANRKID